MMSFYATDFSRNFLIAQSQITSYLHANPPLLVTDPIAVDLPKCLSPLNTFLVATI